MQGNVLVPLMLFGWVPFTLLLFSVFSARRAVLLSAIAGWMFLPVAEYPLPGFVDYTKDTAIGLSVLIGILAFDSDTLLRLRFNRMDLPMAVWCLCPMLTSLMNNLGPYDGLSGVLDRTFIWAAPYAVGRIYFGTFAGLRELAIAITIGGVVYAPFCLWEVRMSPQLHVQLYGYFAHAGGFAQVFRFGGWRPMVFMHHGLMLGLWMTMATLMAFSLWYSGTKRDLLGIPMFLIFLGLAATCVLIKSSGAVALLAVGLAALFASKQLRLSFPVWALILTPALYATLRTPGWWDGQNLVHVVESTLGPDRAHSIDYRLEAEGLLAAKGMEQPIYGWGEHNRGRVEWDKSPDGMVVPDGQWIQALNVNGLIGITSLLLLFLVPVGLLAWKISPSLWGRNQLVLLGGVALIPMLYMLDNLMNAMVNPIYYLVLGGISGYVLNNPGAFRVSRRRLKFRPSQIRWIVEKRERLQPARSRS
jgi:hypothetical protein